MSEFISKKARRGLDIQDLNIQLNHGIIEVSKNNKLINVLKVHKNCIIKQENNLIFISNSDNLVNAGTDYGNFENLIQGIFKPFTSRVNIKGSGYKVILTEKQITLSIGFSHVIIVEIPQGITAVIDNTKKSTGKATLISIVFTSSSIDILSSFVSKLEKLRKPDPYKGSGIGIDTKYYVMKKSSKKGGK